MSTTVTAAGSSGWAGASFAGAAASRGLLCIRRKLLRCGFRFCGGGLLLQNGIGVCSCMVLSNLPQSLRQGKISDSALSAASSQDSR